jgi:hypothetical protein
MIQVAKQDIEEKSQHNFEMDRQTLELLVFVWHWLFESMESKKGKKDTVWGTGKRSNRLRALNIVHKFLLLQLEAIFISSADLDLIINDLVFKSIRTCLENQEVLKNGAVRESISDTISHCASRYTSCLTGFIC